MIASGRYAAWIAIFLSIGIVVLFDAQKSIGIVGALACAAGLVLLRNNHPFVTQLGLAASMAGQAGLFFGIGSYFHDFRTAATAMALILIVPSLLITNAIYHVWCTAASILLLASSLNLNRPQNPRHRRKRLPHHPPRRSPCGKSRRLELPARCWRAPPQVPQPPRPHLHR